ncbi:hypothetical protein M9457_27700, partial [Klebsiella pneumoniae]|nr:hypothetical protein [Klebsiella pneumoniae]
LSNGLGLLGVNIFWMGAIKGGLILVVLALGGQTQRRRGMSQITLSNGLGLLGVNIFWMGAIKGGLILVVLALGGQ